MLHLGSCSRGWARACRRLWAWRASFPVAFTVAYTGSLFVLTVAFVSGGRTEVALALVFHLWVGFVFLRQYLSAFRKVQSLASEFTPQEVVRDRSPPPEDLHRLGRLGDVVGHLIAGLRLTKEQLLHSQVDAVKTIALAMEARDPSTQGHCLRVRHLTRRILERLGVPREERELIEIGALLHDVGKIGVPDELLFKRGKLTEEERARVMLHVQTGVEIIEPMANLRDVATLVKHHHERYDGHGYPDGLSGRDIPLGSRVISVADAVDAMRSSRPYRKGLALAAVVAEIRRASGTQLDPEIVEVAVDVLSATRELRAGEPGESLDPPTADDPHARDEALPQDPSEEAQTASIAETASAR